jgi:hypothetical protein
MMTIVYKNKNYLDIPIYQSVLSELESSATKLLLASETQSTRYSWIGTHAQLLRSQIVTLSYFSTIFLDKT